MPLTALLQTFAVSAITSQRIKGFVRSELAGLLRTLADQEYSAAIRALKDAEVSAEPSREIGSAITTLRLAFERSMDSTFNLADRWPTFQGKLFYSDSGMNPPAALRASERAAECAFLLAVCYASFPNEVILVRKYIDEFERALNEHGAIADYWYTTEAFHRSRRGGPRREALFGEGRSGAANASRHQALRFKESKQNADHVVSQIFAAIEDRVALQRAEEELAASRREVVCKIIYPGTFCLINWQVKMYFDHVLIGEDSIRTTFSRSVTCGTGRHVVSIRWNDSRVDNVVEFSSAGNFLISCSHSTWSQPFLIHEPVLVM